MLTDQRASPHKHQTLYGITRHDVYSSFVGIIMSQTRWLHTIAGLRRRVRRMGTSRSSLIMLCQSSGLPATCRI